MEDVKTWIIDWFVKNTDFDKEEIEKNLNESYFEHQWIDSFSFINFISDIEENFSISFSNDEFQNREFATISGLTSIIKGKLNV